MVVAGEGTVTIRVSGTTKAIGVSGTPKSYLLLKTAGIEKGSFKVTLSEGLEAHSLTFG